MIDLYDIVDVVSKKLNVTLVLHKNMKVHPTYRVYKTFCYNLYKVENGENTLILTHEETIKVPSENIEKVWSDCDKLYLDKFIEFILNDGI